MERKFMRLSLNNLFRSTVLAGASLLLAGPAHAGLVTFQVNSLGTTNASAIEHNYVTGDDRGSMAVTGSAVYYSGDAATGRFNSNALNTSASLTRRDGIFANIHGGALYSFGTNASTPFAHSFAGGFTLSHLLALDANANPTGASVALSKAITFSQGQSNGVFVGYDSVLVFKNSSGGNYGGDSTVTGEVLKIDIASGAVTSLGNRTLEAAGVENWAFYGVAEYFGGQDYIAYANDANGSYPTDAIVRTRVADGVTSTIASFNGLSDLGTFGVAPTLNRWYFHYEGNGQFRSGDETIGFADASFTIVESSDVPEPASLALFGLGLLGICVSRRRN
jgi:hypothetical protein